MFRPTKRVPSGTNQSVIRHLYEQCGGAKQVAFLLDLKESRTYQIAEEGALTLDQAARLTLAGTATAAAEYLATLAGGRFVPGRRCNDTISVMIADSNRHHAEAVSRAVAALADGVIEHHEAGDICAALDAAQSRITALRQSLSPICGEAQ